MFVLFIFRFHCTLLSVYQYLINEFQLAFIYTKIKFCLVRPPSSCIMFYKKYIVNHIQISGGRLIKKIKNSNYYGSNVHLDLRIF